MSISKSYIEQTFEAAFLGCSVWRLNDPSAAGAVVAAAKKSTDVGLISCRVPEGDDISNLIAAGFRDVETLITLRAAIWQVDEVSSNVRRTKACDAKACGEVARLAFKDDRFHKDPELSNKMADDIKAAWVENSVNGRADAVFCAEIDRKIVGFNACLRDGDEAVIDLIGIHPQFQGQGLGRNLLDIMALFYRGRASHIRFGTQASNKESLKFYDSFGFEEISRTQTWHWTP